MTVESKLAEWSRQPGAFVTLAEVTFIEHMRQARAAGVGYGWMQQVIEWEWQTNGQAAWGPEYFGKRIRELESDISALRHGGDGK